MNNDINEKIVHAAPVPPFVTFVASAVPMVFDNSMSYYEALCALWKWLQDDVIDVINNNASVTEQYIEYDLHTRELFIELKSYVDNYFDNLDVQQEINNKLDAMVEDGTFSNLITPIVGNQINELSAEVTTSLSDFSKTLGEQKMVENRKTHYANFTLVTKPIEFTEDVFKDTNIYTNNKGDYIVNYNKANYVNQSSTNTWYVAPNGSDSNSGEDADHPWKALSNNTMSNLQSGDTVIFKGGYYYRGHGFTAKAIPVGVNLITDGNPVIITLYDDSLTWTQSGTNSWTTTRSGVRALYDITHYKEGKFIPLTLVNSAATVDSTPNTYYIDGSNNVYVHMYDNIQPSVETLSIVLGTGSATVTIEPTANDQKYYIKDFTFIANDNGSIVANASSYTGCSILIENTKIYNTWSTSYSYDSFSNKGFSSICDHVDCINTKKDAFNYHYSSGNLQAYGIEINCNVNNCGEGQTDSAKLSNNASTAHNTCKVIRINGNYTLCNGGVVVDIDDSVGALYGCLIGDSYGRNYDVYASGNAVMYLYDCYLKGSTATHNLLTAGSGVIYVSNCQYDTSQGNIIDLNA